MAAAILQFFLALVAGFFVFRLWRRVTVVSRPIFWLVTVGTLVRAVGGLLGFWISYLELPVARSLQLGRGLWFFGVDAAMYFDFSAAAAARGPMAILHLDKGLPSPFFLQVLAAAILLFGAVSSVAILLNVVAYLASCRIILSFDSPDQQRFVVFAIAVLSLAPSVVVWSLQPMKDVVFFFLIIAFFCSARMWQQLWRDTTAPMPAVRGLLLWPAAMAALLYGISGIRWYFAFMVLLSSLPFLLLAMIPARRRLVAGASALLVFVLLAAAFFAGGSRYVPDSVRAAARNINKAIVLPKTLVGLIVKARNDFDRSGGATLIGAGGAIRKLDHNIGAKETRVAASPVPPPVLVTAAGPVKLASRARTAVRRAKSEPAAHREDNPTTAATVSTAPPAAPPAAPAPVPAPVPVVVVVARPVAEPKDSSVTTEGAAVSADTVMMPASTAGRLLAGTAAVLLPQWVARKIGVLDVRGGRGLWLFVEVDTIFFDIVFAFAVISVIRAARRRTLRAPIFWMIFFVTVTIGASLAYTVSNFGTLFRHRDMFLVGLALLPVAAAGSRPIKQVAVVEPGPALGEAASV